MHITNSTYEIFKRMDFEAIKQNIMDIALECFEIYKEYIIAKNIDDHYDELIDDYPSNDTYSIDVEKIMKIIKPKTDKIKLSDHYKYEAVSIVYDYINDSDLLESPYEWFYNSFEKGRYDASLIIAEELNWRDLYSRHIFDIMSETLNIAPF